MDLGGGAEPELQIILEIASCNAACNQDKTGSDWGRWKVTVNFCEARPWCLFISEAEWEDMHYSGCENVPALIIFNLIIHPLSFYHSCDQKRGKTGCWRMPSPLPGPSNTVASVFQSEHHPCYDLNQQHYCCALRVGCDLAAVMRVIRCKRQL